MEITLAKVIDHEKTKDLLVVMSQDGSIITGGVRVLRSRASRRYGVAGNLPDVGELGLILRSDENGSESFWLGSVAGYIEHLGSADGDNIWHLDNNMYIRTADDGELELVHPSGSYMKLTTGSLALAQRKRQILKDGTFNQSEEVNYDPCSMQPVNMRFRHAYRDGAVTTKECPKDSRKLTKDSGTIKYTDFEIDEQGELTLSQDGNVVLKITASGTILLEPMSGEELQLGGNSSLEKLIDARFLALFNAHIHAGDGVVPTVQIPDDNSATTSITKGK